MKSVCVFCASALGNNKSHIEAAYDFGRHLALNNLTLVYGGAKVGLMGCVANGVLDNGGYVVGVLPYFFKEKEIAHEDIHEMIMVNSMAERKLKMLDISDAFVALPGGFGTLDEISEVLSLVQLGKYQKPLGLLNIDGFYDPLHLYFESMFTNQYIGENHKKIYMIADNAELLVSEIKKHEPPELKKWIQ